MEALLGAYGAIEDDPVAQGENPSNAPSRSALAPVPSPGSDPSKKRKFDEISPEISNKPLDNSTKDGDEKGPRPKVPRLDEAQLELSTFFLDKAAEEKKIEEERAAHGGRARSFPHIPNNIPAHIFLPCKIAEPFLKAKSEAISHHTSTNPSFPTLNTFSEAEVHLSLSRPFALRWTQKDLFISELKKQLEVVRGLDLSALEVDAISYFANDDFSRGFLSLSIGSGKEEIVEMIRAVDAAMASMGFPTFYENPIPHISIVGPLQLKVGYTLYDFNL